MYWSGIRHCSPAFSTMKVAPNRQATDLKTAEPEVSKPSAPVEKSSGAQAERGGAQANSRSVEYAAEPVHNKPMSKGDEPSGVQSEAIEGSSKGSGQPKQADSHSAEEGNEETVVEKSDGETKSEDVPEGKAMKEFVCAFAPNAETVSIVGTFSEWRDQVSMDKGEDAIFRTTIAIEKGTHMYKFVIDGEWCYDFTAENRADEKGNVNNVIEVE